MATDQAQVELEAEQQKTVPANPLEEVTFIFLTRCFKFRSLDTLSQVPDYDDESGVYLGPGRSFDDEDLEYLNNKDVEEQKSLQRDHNLEPPASPLIVDSVSGIYLGFEDKEEEDSQTEDADEKPGSEDTDPEDVSLGTDVKASKMFGFFKRKQSKYEVNSEPDLELDAEDGHCFKFIRKVWRKAEVCQ